MKNYIKEEAIAENEFSSMKAEERNKKDSHNYDKLTVGELLDYGKSSYSQRKAIIYYLISKLCE